MHPFALVGLLVYEKRVMMGDMADWTIQQFIDYIDDGCGPDDDGSRYCVATRCCKYCGKDGMYWWIVSEPGERPERWRLFDERTKEPHTCKEYRAK